MAVDPHRSFGLLLSDVSRLLRRNAMRRLAPVGLTEAQARALAHLARNEGTNQVCLAEILEIQPITLGRTIDKLVDGGLVERRPDPKDRRAVRLYLLPAARPVLEEMWARTAETRDDAFAGLDEATREHLIDTLLTIKNNLLAADGATGAKGSATDD